jgi:uncharacterized PurR-regulated membrane protein YhhQ (DUF165 family)
MRRAMRLAILLGFGVAAIACLAAWALWHAHDSEDPREPPLQLAWLFVGVIALSGFAAALLFVSTLRGVLVERYGEGEARSRVKA